MFENVPLGTVIQMEIDPSGTCLALVAETEISVIYLSPSPAALFSHLSLSRGDCKSMFLDAGGPEKHLLVRWHPDFSGGSFLFALCDDNTMKTYRSTVAIPLAVINLNQSSFQYSLSKSYGSELANRFARKFDFGLPVADYAQQPVRYCWPIFLITTDCQLSCMLVDVHERKFHRFGYLKMSPGRFDNYETQVLDFACMTNCGLTVLVILGSGGQIYHCLALQQKQNREMLANPDDAFCVHAYEVLDLQNILSLHPPLTETRIVLHLDPYDPLHYFISHPKGVHEVTLPWIEEFKSTSKCDGGAESVEFSLSSVIPIFRCVRSGNKKESPILGLARIPHALGRSILMLLLKEKGLVTFELPRCRPSTSKQHEKAHLDPFHISTTPNDNFLENIIQLLRRQTPFPHISIIPKEVGSKGSYLVCKERFNHLRKELDDLKECFRLLNAKIVLMGSTCSGHVRAVEHISKVVECLKDNGSRLRGKLSDQKYAIERINEWLDFVVRCLCEVQGIQRTVAERSLLAEIEYYEQRVGDLAGHIEAVGRTIGLGTSRTETAGKSDLEAVRLLVRRLDKTQSRLTLLVDRLSELERVQ